MQNKELVISLIQQDLKHHQLIIGLESISLNRPMRAHQDMKALDSILNIRDIYLDLLDICCILMKVPKSAEIDWGMTYTNYMNKALRHRMEATSEGLKELAELCYRHLKSIVDLENKRIAKH
jgi:hypothetical protein